MKQTIFFFITLMLISVQGWANPVDSLRNHTNTEREVNGFELFDGEGNSDGFRRNDSLLVWDYEYFNAGTTAETSSSSSRYIKVTKVQKGVFDSYDCTWYTPGGYYGGEVVTYTFDVESYNINDYTLQISGTNSNMFSLDKYSVHAGSGKVTRTVKLSYRITKPGIHQVYIIIKEKNPGFLRIARQYKLRVMCATLYYSNSIPNPYDDDDINNTDDALEMTWTNTSGVNELAAEEKIYPEGQNIIIESAVEQNAIISDVAGHAQTVQLQAGYNEIPVNSGGLYIVRIREKSVKLMIR